MTEQEQQARLRAIVEEYFADVWRFLRHLGVPESSVDDAAQDVFVVAARRIHEIQVGRERSFLFGTAYNVAQSARRRLFRSDDEEALERAVDRAPTPEEHLDDQQTRSLALRLLQELDEGMREVFVLYEIEGLTMQRIAELMNLPIGTVGSRLRRAREEFLKRFERHRNSVRGAK
ncbi:RNA polymerase sigma factor RpoE [Labilithrix luteola]|uniref:RNA polymerase sigma factor RpoE n=2 Tax=Labilithrix luteola TaxID=1391654 RepID=A0A0K1Q4U0_9BACT|nr:RNA polymerase sigma factor RpoE [Labilithrix luteola]